MLEKRLVPIPFAGGLDTKTDPKQVQLGKLLDLQNGIFQQAGAINRRWGYRALGTNILGTAQSISSAFAVQAFNNEMLLYDGLKAYSYIPANDAWASRGSIVSVIETNQQVIANSSQQLSPDFGTLNGIEVYAWEDSRGGIRYSVRDAATGAFVLTDQPLFAGMPSTAIRPKVVPAPASGALIVFFTTTAGTLGYVPIFTANPTATQVSVTLFTNLVTPVYYDIASSAPYLFIAATQLGAGGVSNFQLMRLSSLQAIDWTVTVSTGGAGTVGLTAIAVPPDQSAVWYVFSQNGGAGNPQVALYSVSTGAFIRNANVFAGSFGSVFSVGLIVLPVSGVNTGYIFFEVQDAGLNPSNQRIYRNTFDANGNKQYLGGSVPVFVRSVGLASKPFQYNGSVYVNVAYQSNQQSTYFTLDASGNVVAKIFPGLCGGLIQNSDSMLPECPAISPGVFKFANLIRGTVNTVAGQVVALLGVNATKLDFADTNHFLSESLNGDLYTIGGILQQYDGAQYVEHGFHTYPEVSSTNFTPSGAGGSMATGTYNYCIEYHWVNNNNQTDVSTPSVAVAVSVTSGGSTGSVAISIPTLRLTKKTRVKIVVYRTAPSVGAGTILYRVTSALAPVYNDPTLDSITFTDTLADASITSNGAMDTQPLNLNAGNPVLPNSAPPSCSLIATFDDRIILSGLDDPYSWWPSQQAIPGAPAQFSAALAQRLDPDGGPITALIRMDDKLFFFKTNAIFYISGQGPTATGDNSQFTTPSLVPSGEVGCVNANAIVLTPVGIMFQSANGIYLLDRALNVSYKGAPVEKFTSPNQLNLQVLSATVIPNQWVIFTTNSSTALVYDFFYDQWSTFTNHAAVDSDLYLGQGDVLTWCASNGQVYLQTPTLFTDAGQPINFSATMLLQFAGLQGFQRIYELFLLGQYKGSGNGTHNLQVSCAFDFEDQYTRFALIPIDSAMALSTFGSSSPFGAGSPFGDSQQGNAQFQFRLDVLQKCQAMRVQLTDSQAMPGDEAFSLSAITARVGVKKSPYKGVPSGKIFGVS